MSMRKAVYPFLGAHYVSQSGAVHRQTPDPILPIVIMKPDGSPGLPIDAAQIDTGADCCLCPSRITKILGYKLRSGIPQSFNSATGKGKAWRHFIDIAILTPDYSKFFHILPQVPIDLVQKHLAKERKSFPILIGRERFLDQFVLEVNYIDQTVTIKISN